jgi:hypothetical protein
MTSQPSHQAYKEKKPSNKLIFGPRYTISDHLLVEFAPQNSSVSKGSGQEVSFQILSAGEEHIGALAGESYIYQIDLC